MENKSIIMEIINSQLLIPINYKNRPSCSGILEFMNSNNKNWTLNNDEIEKLEIFDNFECLLSEENEFFLNFMKSKNPISI